MAITVKLSDNLVKDAKRIAKVEHRSVPSQIEFYFRMALIAEQNPDLSFKLIREIMKAQAEDATEEYTFG
jgi:predicted transcriptional regulator